MPEFDSQSWDDLAVAFIGLTVEYAKCAARHDATVRAYDGLR